MSTEARGRRKVRTGVVVSDSMDKTVVVKVERRVRHAFFRKVLRVQKKYYAHDEGNECRMGDKVQLMETRPRSKRKRWRVTEIIEDMPNDEQAVKVEGKS